jgi:hypothetical protein
MSFTGTGFDVSTRGGSFGAKNVSLTFWTRDFHKPGSEPLGMSRFNSGSDAEFCGGLKSKVAIYVIRVIS